MYDVVNNYTPDFKSFCENKTVVNVYEYKVDKTYKLTLVTMAELKIEYVK